MNDSLRLDVLDAIEIAEILDYLMERLESLAEHDLHRVLANDDPDNLANLGSSVARLRNKLLTAKVLMSPKLAPVARVNEPSEEDGADGGQP